MSKGKSGGKADGLPVLDRSPSHLLHRALQLALDIYADEFGPGGVTQRQYAVLAAVETQEGLTQTDLVRITGIDRSTLADMAARMIAKGLLERQRSASDARANAVSLTEAGRFALDEARPKMAAADSRLLKLLSGGKRETLTGLLRDLIKAGDEAQAPGPVAEKPAKKPKADKPKKAKADKPAKAAKPEKKKTKKAA
ncbi:MarR family winged helix-turn-helix transcriptional regulator [Phenylobacterium aquaticum]|uniref:MarR family winged helix-turn-helix transcriptional regulator n=1 Tax=Phenylobacterium aquaticum TaxID=1763816 RepID=UPI0026EC3CD8|nr:MarR family transcriptional regulator [Phenylobacterium aquaticum]